MKTIIAKHVAACIAEIRGEVEREIHAAISALVPLSADKPRAKPKRAERSSARTKPLARATQAATPTRGPKAKDRATAPLANVSAKPAPRTGKRAIMRCGKCGELGYRADGCGRTHNTAGGKPARKSATDDEDSGAGLPADRPRRDLDADVPDVRGLDDAHDPEAAPPEPRRRGRPRKAALAPGEELPVIPHARLVSMLAADRANNAVGDLGGVVLGANAGPSLVGHADTKREHCPLHGWVGRVAFERDGHEHCKAERPAGATDCPDCEGTAGRS